MSLEKFAVIKGVEYAFPSTILTNNDLTEKMDLDWEPEDISKKTGIFQRYIATENEYASTLGIQAAQKLFAKKYCKPEDLDFLLFCTQSPDYFLPASACLIHKELGLRPDCGALDFNQGCAGYIYGLSLCKSLIESGMAQHVLLITAETYSKHIHPQDKSTRTIFGDGGAATLVSVAEHNGIGSVVVGTDGSGASNLIVEAGGMRNPKSNETKQEVVDENGNVRCKENLYMNGPEIFNFTIRTIPRVTNELLKKEKLNLDDIDFFIFHQANKFMLEHLRKKIKIPEDKFWINMAECGNTVSASIPIALKMAKDTGKIEQGDKVMLVGFGVGYSWGACIVEI